VSRTGEAVTLGLAGDGGLVPGQGEIYVRYAVFFDFFCTKCSVKVSLLV